MKITKEQLLAWLGSDVTKDTLVGVLLEIANEEYEVDALRSDILFYEDANSDDTYDEYGVNTKNSFNTPPTDEPHPSGVTAEWNGEDWVFRGELIQHHWGMSSTCFSPSELGYTYNDAARLAPYKAIDALVLWLAAE